MGREGGLYWCQFRVIILSCFHGKCACQFKYIVYWKLALGEQEEGDEVKEGRGKRGSFQMTTNQ